MTRGKTGAIVTCRFCGGWFYLKGATMDEIKDAAKALGTFSYCDAEIILTCNKCRSRGAIRRDHNQVGERGVVWRAMKSLAELDYEVYTTLNLSARDFHRQYGSRRAVARIEHKRFWDLAGRIAKPFTIEVTEDLKTVAAVFREAGLKVSVGVGRITVHGMA